MTTPILGLPTTALETYLAELQAHLRGPRTSRARILAEIRDGLTDGVQARIGHGSTPETATAAAIDEFGDPASVADSFAEELATASARRTIAAFILTGPLVGIWWLLLLHPAPSRADALAMLIAIPALPLVALAIAAGAGTYATTGKLMRWLPETAPARALDATTAIATLCIAGDLTMVGLLTSRILTAEHTPPVLATIAAAASLLRICVTTLTIRHCRSRRTALSAN